MTTVHLSTRPEYIKQHIFRRPEILLTLVLLLYAFTNCITMAESFLHCASDSPDSLSGGRDSTSVAQDIASGGQDSASVARDCASGRQCSASGGRDSASGGRDSASIARDIASGGRDSSSVARDSSSVARDSASGGRDSVSGGRDSASDARDIASGGRDSASVARDSASGGRDSASGGRDSASICRHIASFCRDNTTVGRNCAFGCRVIASYGRDGTPFGPDIVLGVEVRGDDEYISIHDEVVVVDAVAAVDETSADCNIAKKKSMKYSLNRKSRAKKIAADTGSCKDEVDGDAAKPTRKCTDIGKLDGKSGQIIIDSRNLIAGMSLNLPTDAVKPSSNNEYNTNQFNNEFHTNRLKELCSQMTVKITTPNSKGSGTLIHPKIWQTFRASQRLSLISMGCKADSASLMIKTSKKLIMTEQDAAAAVVEITMYDNATKLCVLTLDRCSKKCYDIEDCTLLVCHDVPMKVCEYLETTYESLCQLAVSISRDNSLYWKKFLLIGHRNGGEIVVFEGTSNDDINLQEYDFLSLEESAEHFFARTMAMTLQEWSTVKGNICPGDEGLSIVRFGPGCFN